MSESSFQFSVETELKKLFPGCVVQKIESYIRGWPDLLVLWEKQWACLECKKSREDYEKSLIRQPAQQHWVRYLNDMSFAAYIYPENKEEVLHDLQRAFKT